MRRGSLLQCLQETPKSAFSFFLAVAQEAEHSLLKLPVMDSDAAASKFAAIAHYIVVLTMNSGRLAIEKFHIFPSRSRKRMVHGFPTVLSFIPFQKREINKKGTSG